MYWHMPSVKHYDSCWRYKGNMREGGKEKGKEGDRGREGVGERLKK